MTILKNDHCAQETSTCPWHIMIHSFITVRTGLYSLCSGWRMTFAQLVLPPILLMHRFALHTLQLFSKQTHSTDTPAWQHRGTLSDFQSTCILQSGIVNKIPLLSLSHGCFVNLSTWMFVSRRIHSGNDRVFLRELKEFWLQGRAYTGRSRFNKMFMQHAGFMFLASEVCR